jgi:protocatechuate 3,4-dioxygenase beta subunit
VRERMICRHDWETTEDHWQLGFKWDIVLRGPDAVMFEEPHT